MNQTNTRTCLGQCLRISSLSLWLGGPLTSVIVVLGLVGTSLGLRVLVKKRVGGEELRRSLGFLAAWDAILLGSSLSYYGLRRSCDLILSNVDLARPFAQLTVIAHPLISTSYTASSLHLLLLTGQRYVAIAFPLWSAKASFRFFQPQLFVSFLALTVHLPSFFEMQLGCCKKISPEMIESTAQPSWLRLNSSYALYWRLIFVKAGLTTLLPSFLVGALSLGLVSELRKASRLRRQLTSLRYPDQRGDDLDAERITSTILLVISGKCLASHLLPSVLDVWDVWVHQTGGRWPDWLAVDQFMIVVEISNFLVVANSATNAMVYVSGRQAKALASCWNKSIAPDSLLQPDVELVEPASLISRSKAQRLRLTNAALWLQEGARSRIQVALFVGAPDMWERLDRGWKVQESAPNFFQSHTESLERFINQLVKYSNDETELFVQSAIDKVVQSHLRAGVYIQAEDWARLRVSLVREATASGSSCHNTQMTEEAWDIFLDYLRCCYQTLEQIQLDRTEIT